MVLGSSPLAVSPLVEFDTLKNLSLHKHIIIQKPDEGNSRVKLTETSILKRSRAL